MKFPKKCNGRRKRLFKAQDGKCHYCLKPTTFKKNQPDTFTVDHVVPASRGGKRKRENVVGACKSCNEEKADMSYEEYFALKFEQMTGVKFKGFVSGGPRFGVITL